MSLIFVQLNTDTHMQSSGIVRITVIIIEPSIRSTIFFDQNTD